MKYTSEITIDLPLDRVIELFDDPENLKHWQPGLVSYHHQSGTPGETGAKTLLRYKMGKRQIDMVETILEKDLPHQFNGTYETKGVYNYQKNTFQSDGPGRTIWSSETEFRFDALSMKFFAWLMPGAFKKQTYKFMELFKNFAESESAKETSE